MKLSEKIADRLHAAAEAIETNETETKVASFVNDATEAWTQFRAIRKERSS